MAGLSGGFDGKYTSLKNIPELPEGVSNNDYRSSENRTYSRQGEQDFEIGLNQIGYPDGFYDSFVDQSKISSSTNLDITTGTNGNIILDYDGDVVSTGESEDLGTGNYQQTGSISFDVTMIEGGIISQMEQYTVDTVTSIEIQDSSNNVLASSTNSTANFTVADYTRLANVGETLTVVLSGSQMMETPDSYSYSGNYFNIPPQTNVPDSTSSITVKKKSRFLSGSITSTTQDKGYSASKATLTADYALNGQSIDSIDLFDGADNLLASWTESEIGETKAVSTSRTDYYLKADLSGDGTDTPKVNKYEMGLDN